MAVEKSKCGEIFRITEGKYLFICFHCGDEFQSPSKIVKHIETHFQWNGLPFAAAFDLSVDVKKEVEEDIADVTVTDFLTTKLEKVEDAVGGGPLETIRKNVDSHATKPDEDEDSDYWPGDLFDLAGDDFNEPQVKPELETKGMGRKRKANSGTGGGKRRPNKQRWVPKKKPATYVCEPCGATYEYKNDLRLHILDSHAKKMKTFECDVCASKFKSKFSILKHLNRHRPEDFTVAEPMICQYCQRKFPFVNTYRKHIAAHEAAIELEKRKPSVSTAPVNRAALVERVKPDGTRVAVKKRRQKPRPKPMGNQPPKAICSECGKGFKTKCALKKHYYIHTGERPYVCEVCNKGYYTNSYLKIHRRIHTGEKPYQCNQCGKKFVAANVLNEHLKWHNNSRPFKCTQCPKTFLLLENLKRHEPKHNQIRPVCEICNKSFSLDRTFRQHMLLHEGIGKHKCHYCDASFSSSVSRQKHEHVMHRVNDTFISQTQIAMPPILLQQQQPPPPPPMSTTGYYH